MKDKTTTVELICLDCEHELNRNRGPGTYAPCNNCGGPVVEKAAYDYNPEPDNYEARALGFTALD